MEQVQDGLLFPEKTKMRVLDSSALNGFPAQQSYLPNYPGGTIVNLNLQ